ncbi:hypothetical protein DNTS_004415, partial [Danionella cerebrum]
VEGEDTLVVSSDQKHRREVLGQRVQPGHIESAGHRPLPGQRHGSNGKQSQESQERGSTWAPGARSAGSDDSTEGGEQQHQLSEERGNQLVVSDPPGLLALQLLRGVLLQLVLPQSVRVDLITKQQLTANLSGKNKGPPSSKSHQTSMVPRLCFFWNCRLADNSFSSSGLSFRGDFLLSGIRHNEKGLRNEIFWRGVSIAGVMVSISQEWEAVPLKMSGLLLEDSPSRETRRSAIAGDFSWEDTYSKNTFGYDDKRMCKGCASSANLQQILGSLSQIVSEHWRVKRFDSGFQEPALESDLLVQKLLIVGSYHPDVSADHQPHVFGEAVNQREQSRPGVGGTTENQTLRPEREKEQTSLHTAEPEVLDVVLDPCELETVSQSLIVHQRLSGRAPVHI